MNTDAPSVTGDPAYWRGRADQYRFIAELVDPAQREDMYEFSDECEQLALDLNQGKTAPYLFLTSAYWQGSADTLRVVALHTPDQERRLELLAMVVTCEKKQSEIEQHDNRQGRAMRPGKDHQPQGE